jgi:hypothetical protein
MMIPQVKAQLVIQLPMLGRQRMVLPKSPPVRAFKLQRKHCTNTCLVKVAKVRFRHQEPARVLFCWNPGQRIV